MALLYAQAMHQGNQAAPSIHISPEREFDVILRPHRSLPPAGFVALMAGVAVVSFIAGMAFWVMGAWPVTGFFGLDALLLYAAFKLNYADRQAHERIMMKAGKLTVRQHDRKGRLRQWQFEPYWVRLDLITGPAGDSRLLLGSHGRTIPIADCLGADEKKLFAQALRQALAATRL